MQADGTRREAMEEAIERALALLPYEDPASDHPGDARRWIQVYRELIDLKHGVLERLERELRPLSADAREEVGGTDAILLTKQRDHYQERLEFWHRRHWQLSRLDLDAQAGLVRHGGREVELTRRETQLLECLVARPGRYVSAEYILRSAWGDGALHRDQVRTYVARLRRKLARIEAPTQIVNRARSGYTLVYEDEKKP
ncbi:MAG: winged helix-turn-helix domain-containing protein [Candidatus Dormibacteria bacterium]